jgi:hypothetical protein
VVAAFGTWPHLLEVLPTTSQPRVGTRPIAEHHAQRGNLCGASNGTNAIASIHEGAVGTLGCLHRLREGACVLQRLRPGDQECSRRRGSTLDEPGIRGTCRLPVALRASGFCFSQQPFFVHWG